MYVYKLIVPPEFKMNWKKMSVFRNHEISSDVLNGVQLQLSVPYITQQICFYFGQNSCHIVSAETFLPNHDFERNGASD